VTIHVPLNDETRGLIGEAEFALMKPGSILINIARGGIVDEAALLRALSDGHLRGAGLDVHENEGEGRISPLAHLENVVLTPHIGAATIDSQAEIGREVVNLIAELEKHAESSWREATPLSWRGHGRQSGGHGRRARCAQRQADRAHERAGIAGICIEDNLFPKRNSLYRGESRRELIPPTEQARRLRAAKAAQDDEGFFVIARVEALIAGYGVEDACERADAYADAGADAILIHSRDKTLAEIEGFLGQWSGVGQVPLVAVPTLFPTFSADQLHAKGFTVIILANQPMRASVQAMEETLRTMAEHGTAASVDPTIATVDHIFDLVDTRAVIAAEDEVGGWPVELTTARRAAAGRRHRPR
jgi:2-methylisocitrate lyase-like PEP mutase family enzyme